MFAVKPSKRLLDRQRRGGDTLSQTSTCGARQALMARSR